MNRNRTFGWGEGEVLCLSFVPRAARDMPKLKTRKAAAKRFKATGTGKFMRRRAFRNHLLDHKSPKAQAPPGHQSCRRPHGRGSRGSDDALRLNHGLLF